MVLRHRSYNSAEQKESRKSLRTAVTVDHHYCLTYGESAAASDIVDDFARMARDPQRGITMSRPNVSGAKPLPSQYRQTSPNGWNVTNLSYNEFPAG